MGSRQLYSMRIWEFPTSRRCWAVVQTAGLEDVAGSAARIANTWVGGPSGVKIFSAGPGIDWLADLTSEERGELISTLIEEDLGIDALVIDTAPGIIRRGNRFPASGR